MKIAITGATGYIGSVLTPLLLAAGHELRIHSRPQKARAAAPGITYVYGTLLESACIQKLVQGADAVIHLAAVISVSDTPVKDFFFFNTETTRLLATSAQEAGVKRFIQISSITAFEQAPYDEQMDETRGPTRSIRYGYDHSKAVSQDIALGCNGSGMEVLVLCPTAVTGPYDARPSLIGDAVVRIYKGKIPALFPGGVDFVDVRDVAQAIVHALTMGTPGQVYILSGEWLTLKALSEQIGRIRGKPVRLPVLPVWLIMGLLPVVRLFARITGGAPFYTRQSVYNLIRSNKKIDNSKARSGLQFRPRDITHTLQDTIQWFKETGVIK